MVMLCYYLKNNSVFTFFIGIILFMLKIIILLFISLLINISFADNYNNTNKHDYKVFDYKINASHDKHVVACEKCSICLSHIILNNNAVFSAKLSIDKYTGIFYFSDKSVVLTIDLPPPIIG